MEARQEKLDFEKVWLMFQETTKQFQETDKKFQETTRQFQETDKKFIETDKRFKDTDKKLNKLEYLFTSQWGKLIESLVEGDLVNLLKKRGIDVHSTATRIKSYYNDRQYEFDIIAENGDEIVVVEVKTTLKPEDVTEFLEELQDFKNVLPKYRNNKVFGAVAFLTEDGSSATMASRKGLFSIKATGKSASITNSKSFKPKAF